MTMSMRYLFLTGFLLSFCAGCMGALTTAAPPVYFELSYAPPAAAPCAQTIYESLEVRPFSAAAPYDREEMIILEPSRKVRFSPHYRWITPPGAMIADKLTRDLAAGAPFPQVVASAGPMHGDIQLSGHVHAFAWEDHGEEGQRALLDVQVSVWREKPIRRVLFQKQYRLAGDRSASASPEQFAEAMSLLIARLSSQLQEDLCTTLPDSSSRSFE